MIRTLITASAAALTGYALTRTADALLARSRFAAACQRTNHAGRTVSLREGPAAAAGATAVSLFADPVSHRLAGSLASASAGLLGGVDDFAAAGEEKGLRGHLGALARGQLTTGGLKVTGIPAAAVAAGAIGRSPAPLAGSPTLGAGVDAVLAGGVIAGTANLLNLFDLRPARALKAAGVMAAASLLTGRGTEVVLAAGSLGVIAAAFRADAAGETMLGDTGANALGALLGTAVALDASRAELVLRLAVLAGLTLASEKVSFTAVIESTPVLADFDAWARVH